MIFNLFSEKQQQKKEKMASENLSNHLDSLSDEDLKGWLEGMTRLQKEYYARVNGRVKQILNNTDSLNRWLDEKTRDEILDKVWELQVYRNWKCCFLIYEFF